LTLSLSLSLPNSPPETQFQLLLSLSFFRQAYLGYKELSVYSVFVAKVQSSFSFLDLSSQVLSSTAHLSFSLMGFSFIFFALFFIWVSAVGLDLLWGLAKSSDFVIKI
jgi:hypothetical protein